MFTLHSSKPIMARVGTSLKVGLLVALLGLVAVATERPTLLATAGAVAAADETAYVAEQAKARAAAKSAPATPAVAPATAHFDYLPSHFAAPSGPIEDLPPQF